MVYSVATTRVLLGRTSYKKGENDERKPITI